MDLILVKMGSPEWEFIWKYVQDHPINDNIDEPTLALNNNEAWQYMGSYRQNNRVIHQVRHRYHQTTNNVVTLTFNASDAFNPNDEIAKSFKLK